MSKSRSRRISEEIKKIVSSLIREEIKDPRVSRMTSIVSVDTTRDLRFAYIYVSVLEDNKKEETIEGLNRAKGFIRKSMGEKLDLRYTPEPIFRLDESIENGIYISNLIRQVSPEELKGEDEDDEE